MRFQKLLIRLSRTAPVALVLAAGTSVVLPLDILRTRLRAEALDGAERLHALTLAREEAADVVSDQLALRTLKRKDIAALKQGLSGVAKSKRTVYESGLALQEEKRLLDKQWEILTTFVLVDPKEQKAHIMRGEQALESFPLPLAPRAIPEAAKPPPALVRIVSKERFAHPQRGSYTEKDGRLQWNPPQVGAASRESALGEFVVFTDSSLILHGPPAKKEEHEAYPHFCLGLSLAVARNLYANTFIGTKILLKKSPPSFPVPAAE